MLRELYGALLSSSINFTMYCALPWISISNINIRLLGTKYSWTNSCLLDVLIDWYALHNTWCYIWKHLHHAMAWMVWKQCTKQSGFYVVNVYRLFQKRLLFIPNELLFLIKVKNKIVRAEHFNYNVILMIVNDFANHL